MRARRELTRRFEASAKVRFAFVCVYLLIVLLVGLAIPRDIDSWAGGLLVLGTIIVMSLFTTWFITASPEDRR